MNRGELRSKLSLKLRLPPAGDPTLTETTLNDCLRLALRDVSSVKDWPWLLTTASVTFTAGVGPQPATLVKLRELVVNSLRAHYVELAQFLDIIGNQTGQFVWTDIGTNIQLSPAPTTSPTNTLYFIRGEPELTADTQSPLCPEAHQAAVLARAAFHAEIMRGKADAATVHNQEYEGDIARMMDAPKRRNAPRQIRESGYQIWASW